MAIPLDVAQALFTMLGMASFALAISGSMLMERGWHAIAWTVLLHPLGLLLSLAALPVLAIGLTVQNGMARDDRQTGYRMAGTTVALLSLLVMMVSLGLAWPHPHWILAVGSLDALILATAAVRWRMPVLHAGAIVLAALAYLVGFQYFFGHYYGDLPAAADAITSLDLLKLSISARSGTALTGLFVLSALVAEWFVRRGLSRHGRMYVGGCAVIAVAGLSLVTWHALPWIGNTISRSHDALRAAVLYALYGSVSLGLAIRWRRVGFAYLGISLLAAVPVWLLVRLTDVASFGPFWALTLAVEGLVIGAIALELIALTSRDLPPANRTAWLGIFPQPMLHVAEVLGVLSGLVMLGNLFAEQSWPIAASFACLGLLWLGLAWQHASRSRTWLASLILLAGAVHTLLWNYPDKVWQPWWTAILGHGTVMLAAGLLIDAWTDSRDKDEAPQIKKLRSILGESLEQSALVSSILMLLAAWLPPWGSSLALAWSFLWLAALWLVHSIRRSDASLLAAQQTVLSLSAATFAVARLQMVHPGVDAWQLVFTTDGFQTCGIALAIVSLLWIGVRLAVAAVEAPPGRFALWAEFLENRFCVDRIVRFALPVVQLGLLVALLLPEVMQEFGLIGGTGLLEPGTTAWNLWVLLAATAIASLWERWRFEEMMEAFFVVIAVAGLIAGSFQSDLAVASALRWTLAIAGLAVSIVVGSGHHAGAIRHFMVRSPFAGVRVETNARAVSTIIALLAVSTWLPVLLLSGIAALVQFSGTVPPGPVVGSIFARMDLQVSYLVPLALVITALVERAVRQRSATYAFTAGLVLQMAVALQYVLRIRLTVQSLDSPHVVTILQAATIVAAGWGLMWYVINGMMGLPSRRESLEGSGEPSNTAQELFSPAAPMAIGQLMAAQVATALLTMVILLEPALQQLVLPGVQRAGIYPLDVWTANVANWPSWLAVMLTAVTAWSMLGWKSSRALHVLAVLGFAISILIACRFASPGGDMALWSGYHILQTAWTVCAAVLLAIALAGPAVTNMSARAAWNRPIWSWRVVFDVCVLGLVALNSFVDPQGPWWSLGVVVTISVTAAISAFWLRRPGYSYFSGALVNLAGILIWWGVCRPITIWTMATTISFADANVLSLAVGSTIWSLLGLIAAAQQGTASRSENFLLGYGRCALIGGSLLLGAVIIFALGGDLLRLPPISVGRLDWIALAGMAVAAAVLLWDRSPRLALQTLYGLAIAAIGMSLWARALPPRALLWTAASELAAMALAAGTVGWLLPRIAPLGRMLRVPAAREMPDAGSHANWFVAAQGGLVAGIALLAAWISLDPGFDAVRNLLGIAQLPGRIVGPVVLILLVAAAIVMAAGCRDKVRGGWQFAAFALGALCISAIDWAKLAPAVDLRSLHATIGVVIGAGMMAIISRFALGLALPGNNDWIQQGRRSSAALIALTGAALLAAVTQEVVCAAASIRIELALWEVAIVAVGLLAMAAAGIGFAVSGDWSPLGQDDRQRQVYVYAAEVLLAVMALHLRIVRPEWFGAFLRQYWMFIIMAVAFSGAALGEWFRRRNLTVLYLPLERTAFILPLLPAVGYWLPVDGVHVFSVARHSPAVWFVMGAFYAVMAVSRRSMFSTVLAVVTSNLGLWIALQQVGLRLFVHPQLWLIPPALATLVAEYLHRNRLSDRQRTAVHYMALSVIYVSSTSDMYIAGLGNDWRLPLVLMALAVVGVLLGILLKIRSFLYLGTSFLLVDVSSLLWYAVVDLRQAWILYVSGIVLGVAILALFAVFEKRRNDVLMAVQRLRSWDQ